MTEDIFFEEETDLDEETIVEYDITPSPRDLSPASIVEMVDNNIIELPLFQRNYVWDILKASKLIESLILGLPVPELFFYSENDDTSTYKIIDGQQRFLSVYFFLKGRFPKNNSTRIQIRKALYDGIQFNDIINDNNLFDDFILTLNNASRYSGLNINTLDKDTRIKFRLRRFLRAVVIRQNKPDNDSSSMFEIFNRLNTGGISLNDQEIRASLYYCDFYKTLIKLNDEEEWRNILSKPTEDLRSNDIELILRSLALLVDGDNYAPKMVAFLNMFSEKSKRFTQEKNIYYYKLFMSFIHSCKLLGLKAFFRNDRFSKTLFESVFVAVCKKYSQNAQLVDSLIDPVSFNALKQDKDFVSFLQAGSSSTENLKGRINKAQEIIKLVEE